MAFVPFMAFLICALGVVFMWSERKVSPPWVSYRLRHMFTGTAAVVPLVSALILLLLPLTARDRADAVTEGSAVGPLFFLGMPVLGVGASVVDAGVPGRHLPQNG